jgi:hypothetical protein
MLARLSEANFGDALNLPRRAVHEDSAKPAMPEVMGLFLCLAQLRVEATKWLVGHPDCFQYLMLPLFCRLASASPLVLRMIDHQERDLYPMVLSKCKCPLPDSY